MREKLTNLPRTILDIKGTLMHCYYRGTDIDSLLDTDNTTVNRAEHGLRNWVEEYLMGALKEVAPIQIIAVWDGGNQFRRRMYAGYKKKPESEKPTSPLVVAQLDRLSKMASTLLASLGAIQVSVENQEADDVIAHLATSLTGKVRIYTVDRDLLQLSSSNCLVYLRGIACTEFEDEAHEVYPTSMVRIHKSLVGDKGDTYPGVRGVGPTAFKHLFDTYGEDGLLELEQCVATGNYQPLEQAIAETGDKVLERIYAARYGDKQTETVGWKTCYELARLHPEVCYKNTTGVIPKMAWHKRLPSEEKFDSVVIAAGLQDFCGELRKYLPSVTLLKRPMTAEELRLILAEVEASPLTAFDVESIDILQHEPFREYKGDDYVDVLSHRTVGASVCFGDNLQHLVYFDQGHYGTRRYFEEGHVAGNEGVPTEQVVAVIDRSENLVAHNAKFEMIVTRNSYGYQLQEPLDTAVMSSQVNENLEQGLKVLSATYLNYQQLSYEQLMERGKLAWVADDRGPPPAHFDMRHLPAEEVTEYGCDDSFCTAHLAVLFDTILCLEGTRRFTYEVYPKCTHVMADSFCDGEKIDQELLAKLAAEDSAMVEKNLDEIRALLEANCREPSRKVANLFAAEDIDHHYAKWAEKKEHTSDMLKFRTEELVKEYTEATIYHPYKVTKKAPAWVPTEGKMAMVLGLLSLPVPDKAAKLVTGSGLTAWLASLDSSQLNDQQAKFVALLTAALPSIKSREGEAYEALREFCHVVMAPTMPDVEEGDKLNLGSPDMVSEILYLKLGLPVRRRGKVDYGSFRHQRGLQGSPATDEKAIRLAIAEDTQPGDWKRRVLTLMVETKAAVTRNSYYYKPYPLWEHPLDGNIHGSIIFPATLTRRPTANSPNLLQVTKKDGGKVRNTFVPGDEWVVAAIDWNQQELRIMGSEAKEEFLIRAYNGNPPLDVHISSACLFIAGFLRRFHYEVVKEAGMTPEQFSYELFAEFYDYAGGDKRLSALQKALKAARTAAKIINFLLIYGGGPQAAAMQLSIPTEEAKEYLNTILSNYKGFTAWKEDRLEFARTYGYVPLAYGNRYHIGSKILSKDGEVRSRAERQLINGIVQGTAAEILAELQASVKTSRIMQETGAKALLPIYDEVKVRVPAKAAWEYVTRMQVLMNVTPPNHAIPMSAEVSISPIGKGWGSVVELGANPSYERVMETIYGSSSKN